MNTMDEKVQSLVIDYIKNLWIAHNSENKLLGIWLTLHEDYNEDINDFNIFDIPIIKAWFITNNNVIGKELIDFKLFIEYGLVAEKFFNIAYATTAMMKDKNFVYIGYQLGSLYGKGCLFHVNDENILVRNRDLWIS